MNEGKIKLVNLREIEGKDSPHQDSLYRALKGRIEALGLVGDVNALADFIGGQVEFLRLKEDWAVSKEIFPDIKIYFVFNRGDEEFSAQLRILFSGEKLHMISGEDLTGYTIFIVSHMIRYVRQANPGSKLPEICYRV